MNFSRPFLVLCLLFCLALNNDLRAQQDLPEYNCAPNTLPINPRICIGISETPAYMYKDFLAWIGENKGLNSSDFKKATPDYTKWKDIFSKLSTQKIEERFIDTDQLALMPIVGITKEQALAYCEWKTEAFKAQLAEMGGKEKAQFPKEFRFRLPTANEWARMRFLTQEKAMMKKLKKLANANRNAFKFSKSKAMRDNEMVKDIYAEMHEKLGFYNLFNNVSEMTSIDGQAVGGSWYKANKNENFQEIFEYKGAEPWLGFRVVFEIIR